METELLREATQRARERAEIMATAHGGRLGRVLSLSTQTEIMSTAASAQSSGTEVTAPSVTLGVTVYGRWRLDPAH